MTRESARKGDAAQRAWAVVQEATGQSESFAPKDPSAMARGRAGGLARAEKLSPERRLEIAKTAKSIEEGIGMTSQEITDEELWGIFDRASQRLLKLSGQEFSARWDEGEYSDSSDAAVMQLAMLRPDAFNYTC